MGSYLDTSWADLRALTRLRRLEAFTHTEAAHPPSGPAAKVRTIYRGGEFERRPDWRWTPLARRWQSKRRKRPTLGQQSVESEPWADETHFWRTFRVQVGACYLCGLPFIDEHWATEDHVKPRGRGGSDAWRNILLAHSGCNGWKADRNARPCEAIFLEAVNLILDRRKGERPVSMFVPLRQRIAAQAAE